MRPKKIKLQKYLKIRKGTKKCEESSLSSYPPHFPLLWSFKFFWDIVWLRYRLNKFITLSGCSNDVRKNQTRKIRKVMKNVRNVHILCILPILHFFDVLKKFWDIVWLGYFLNEFITHKGCSNDPWKNQTPKILKN